MTAVNTYFIPVFKDIETEDLHECCINGDKHLEHLMYSYQGDWFLKSKIENYLDQVSPEEREIERENIKQANP